jgi:hypothetical protein
MVLFQCTCGSFFTIKDATMEEGKRIRCPNCGGMTDIFSIHESWKNNGTQQDGSFTVRLIPDNATINVSFNI